MLRVGLTGGIASGKSTVADMFVELGAALVDTDVIAHRTVEPGSAALGAIAEQFGESVIAADGSLDRAALRRIVFASEPERRKLEAILHPLIRTQAVAEMAAASAPYVIAAVPLLVETGFADLVDRVAVVHCTMQQQIDRVTKRSGMSRKEAQAIIAAQTDERTRLAAADDIIDNTGTLAETRAQVERLHEKYLNAPESLPSRGSSRRIAPC